MDLTEGELLRLSAEGNEEAFTVLYRSFERPVYRFALYMSGSRTLAEEVTQEVFIALIRRAGELDPRQGPLLGWLLGVARLSVYKHLNQARRYQPLEQGDQCGLTWENDHLDQMTRREDLDKLRRAVLALPARYREVVTLCDLEEMTYEEAALILGCATGTVRSRLHRARALLAGRMGARVRCQG